MNILGLSFDYHDAAAALIVDGEVIAAAHEERFSRDKHDSGFPIHAIRFCLSEAGLDAGDLDQVVHYERPLLKFDRILKAALKQPRTARAFIGETVVNWFQDGKFDVGKRISSELGVPESKVTFCLHHEAHAAAAFYCSPFEEAAIVTLDGVGEHETATISLGRGNDIQKLNSVKYPDSLGLFYSAFTAFLGFQVNEGEYKVMGMAGFGTPTRMSEVLGLFELKPDGTFSMNQDLFDFLMPEKYPFTSVLTETFGEPREPESEFNPLGPADDPVAEKSRYYADIAASVQKATEEVILHVVRCAMEKTGLKNVCMAGGVALNSVANGRVVRELGANLYVQPAAGDSGSAIGSALHHLHVGLNHPRKGPLTTPYLGFGNYDDDIMTALSDAYLEPEKVFETDKDMVADIAERLSNGSVVGWVQGRAEWGPRSLGARSILADPRYLETQARVNEKIKFRELFRPFAPSVMADRAAELFDFVSVDGVTSPEHFMLSVANVLPEARDRIQAVTHVDGTARVHLVERSVHPIFYDLISAFDRITGVPVLLNTSFNLRGEPIVNTATDAIKTFQWSGMDALVIGRTLILKDDMSI